MGKVITISQKGSFQKTEKFLTAMKKPEIMAVLEKHGEEGCRALANATPTDSGQTAKSWSYATYQKGTFYMLVWKNSNVVDGKPIAILLQYGHGTGNGGYIPGRDYINPAIMPILDRIADEGWKVVTQA